MKFSKQVGLLVVIGIVGVSGHYGWQTFGPGTKGSEASTPRKKARAIAIETAPASFHDLDVIVEAVGSTRALRTVEITPLASGRVTKVGFTAGQVVKQGDVLLRLDEDIQRADLVEADARLTEAINTLTRSETLKKQNAVSVATVDSLKAQVAIAQAEKDRAAKRLKDRVVTAPFSGVVGFSNVELGTRVQDGDVVTVLDDLSVIEVEFSLPEGLFGKVGIGKRVIASAASFPARVFNGKIEQVNSRIDPVSRSFKARAAIANDDRALPAGMFVHLTVVLAAETVLAVPEEAVVVDGSRTYIFAVVKKDAKDHVERRYISIGRRSFGFVEIAQGINEGEHVVIRGLQKVRDGALVEIQSPSATPDTSAEGARS